MYSRITGTGSFLPPKIMTNYDLEEMVDTTHDWIVERSGIHQRHIAVNETVSEMGEQACLLALDMAGKRLMMWILLFLPLLLLILFSQAAPVYCKKD